MRVTNKGSKTLGMPNGVALAANAGTDITPDEARTAIVSAWIARGILEVSQSGGDSMHAEEPEDEKDRLIADLARHGVYRDRRTSIDNLRALRDEVQGESESAD